MVSYWGVLPVREDCLGPWWLPNGRHWHGCPQGPGGLGLIKPTLGHSYRGCQAAFFHLLQRQMRWMPNVVPHRTSAQKDRHRPMLHHLREDH